MESWQTKWGPRRVRHDPPTIEEAIQAAQGLTDDRVAQTAIAAGLMGIPIDDVGREFQRLDINRRPPRTIKARTRGPGAMREVIVEQKSARRHGGPARRTGMTR